jgi:D-alanyl-D-alanine endopeptidase (penicillin-binding protein 7)
MRENEERKMHRLEKLVALCALAAVFVLAAGFARGAEPRGEPHQHELERLRSESPQKVFLRSSVALVQDARTGELLLEKSPAAVLPIASITKLMTAMVLLDRGLDLRQRIVIGAEDVEGTRGARSRLRSGAVLTRDELLLLALMASENRAAAALARTYPGGQEAFVAAMNEKARRLGMQDAHFVDPTGLSSGNVASAQDLALLVRAAHGYPRIREYSTRDAAQVTVFGRTVSYRNTNSLVRSPQWDIGLSKTGYLNEAGRCLVMRTRVASRDLIVVLLDSWGKYSRIGDANRIRRWLESRAAPGASG